jgi:flagellar motor switch/type III secretory pathway protein FliN
VNVVGNAATKKGARKVVSLDPDDVWASRNPKEIWVIGSIGISEMEGRGIRFVAPSDLFLPKLKNSRDALSKHLQRATVTLSVELGRFRLNVAKLWHLKPGTVIPLPTTVGDPLNIAVGGVAKLLGDPMVSRGNVAVRLIEHIENGVK